ncbi:Transmembrane protein [Aphelenchoides besseyi]|nr:Transmembrane protein [Aphelenchoides besseyi]
MRTNCLLLLVGLSVGPKALAKYSSGVISTPQNWIYLDRFCFVSEEGMFQYSLQYPSKFAIESIYLYFDTDSQWAAAYDKNKNCKQKDNLIDPHNNQIIHLTPQYNDEDAVCSTYAKDDKSEWINCTGSRSFYSRRPRWWYLALANCDSINGLYLDYNILMTNGKPSNRWFYHFSFDEFYSLPICIFFMIVDIIILIISIIFTYMLKSRNYFHATFKLYLHSLVLHLSGQVLMWLHYDRYADNGRGFPLLRSFGLLLRQFASVIFVLLLLLVAKGYTITRSKISQTSTVKLIIFMTFYLITNVAMMIWELALFDPAEVTYISESMAAYFQSGLIIIAWLWYLLSSITTSRKYPLKKAFYCVLAILITFWFWAIPVTLVISNFVLDAWVRAEVMLAVESGVMVYGFSVFLVLTNPIQKGVNLFPFHVRTTQISQENNFPQHVYEVSPSLAGPSPHDTQETKY